MSERRVTMAEARAGLPGLVRSVEEGEAIQITRWGAPVAVLVSVDRYRKLTHGRPLFGAALEAFLASSDREDIILGDDEWRDLRDPSPGREPHE